MAFVGYIEKDDGEFSVVAAGSSYEEAFQRTFARIAPMINVFYAPNMAVQEKDISDEEAEELEAICASHLDA